MTAPMISFLVKDSHVGPVGSRKYLLKVVKFGPRPIAQKMHFDLDLISFERAAHNLFKYWWHDVEFTFLALNLYNINGPTFVTESSACGREGLRLKGRCQV
jgi:hypothetical protein